MQYFSITDTGIIRKLNEDYHKELKTKDFILLIVADGLGGHKAGEVASVLAANTISSYFEKSDCVLTNPNQALKEAIDEANRRVLSEASNNFENSNMCTTIVVALIIQDSCYIANVGDSRCYIRNQYGMRQLSRDHSLVNDLLTSGTITEDEAEHFPSRNVVTKAIGSDPQIEAHYIGTDLEDGDYLLLCTDGLYGQIDDDLMIEIIDEKTSLEQKGHDFVEVANDNGGIDNITCIIYRHGGLEK